MKIVISPDSFKGSNTSFKVASLIKEGFLKVYPNAEYVIVPIADGGEGTVDALLYATGGKEESIVATGPLGEKVTAKFGILDNGTAVAEMASASGLPLVPSEKRNPLFTTSYGTGEVLKKILDLGVRKIVMGIGGSATNDGGIGMAQALGVSFKTASGKEARFGGQDLSDIISIDVSKLDPRIKDCEIVIACDVTNPLCGKTGASAVYGPQKGATPEMVKFLDAGLLNLANIIQKDLCLDVKDIPGAGAAGGFGAGAIAFLGAKINSGIETVLETANFDQIVQDASLCITGEGRIDGQSIYGKVPVGVAKFAKKHDVPVLAIVGDIGDNASAVYEYGVDSIMSTVNKAMPLSEAISRSAELLVDGAERAARMIKIGSKL